MQKAVEAIAVDDLKGLDELGLEVPDVVAPIATEEEPAAADVAEAPREEMTHAAPPIATGGHGHDHGLMAADVALAFIAEYDAAVDRVMRTKWRMDDSKAQAKADKEEHQAAIEALQRLRDHRWKSSQDLEQMAIPGVGRTTAPIATTASADPIATGDEDTPDPIATEGEESGDPIATGGDEAPANPIATGDQVEDADNDVDGDDVWPPQDAVQEQ